MPELKTTINIAVAGGPAIAVDNVEELQAYDVIEVEVEGVGILRNPVEAWGS